MLLRRPTLDGIAAGAITCAFRRWDRPRVRPGTRLRTAVGVLAVSAVEPVEPADLTEADARAAGHPDLADLRAMLDRREGRVWRVDLHLDGPDPRIALRSAEVDATARAELDARLARLDRTRPWTAGTLALIADNPGVRAPDLAARLGRETAAFKRDVRKLKELGLTESLEVGYRLSPRGRAYLRR
ncbi:hypothetical protein GCM10023215_06240 [Pseudonocardia yuanmonensis]|uniref:ASCH domain-containing protein n=1 Tax=Pseudonocardia yuanmonensis TaxID=1095914 RepID=A0ABP8W059_9PSEU